MPKSMSPQKVKQAEDAAITVMEKFWNQAQDKKNISRIITFTVLAIAILQEFFLESHLTDSWYEITTYLLMGYFGMATYRSIFKLR